MDRKKYVFEASDDVKKVIALGVTHGGAIWTDTTDIENLEELNSDYINEHYGQLQDEAYKRGFEDGKAVHDKGCEGCLWEGSRVVACTNCCNAYKNKWIAKDDKIEVGDEVIYNGTTKCLVVRPETDERYAVLIDSNGNHHHADHSECKKTGRHFDIQSILEDMKHD